MNSELLAVALETKDWERLRKIVVAMAAQGASREFTLAELEAVRAHLRLLDEEAAEDAIMDVMDHVTGFCSPHARIRFAEDDDGG